MPRSIWVGDLRTGRRITQIPVADGTWEQAHRSGGDLSVDIPLGATDFAPFEREVIGLYPSPDLYLPIIPTPETGVWRAGQGLRPSFMAAVDPARCFLAALEGDTVLEAGPIWKHSYRSAGKMLTVRAAGMWSIFDHRRVMGVVADGAAAAAWSATWSGVSLATMATMLIEQAMAHTHGDLPIDLPDDEYTDADAAHTRTYYGYDLGVLGQRITELMNVQGGPDLALEPYITPDRMGIRWRMRAGTEADPLLHQVGADHVWDASVPQSGVGSIDVDVDATGLASRSWVTGSGSQTSTLMEWADDDLLTSRGYPLLETSDSRSTVQERSTAQSWAAGNLSGQVRPWMQWTVQVSATAHPRLGTYRPGDFVRVWIGQDHPYLRHRVPAGFHRARILRVSGSVRSDVVTVTLAPAMEGR